MPCRSSLHRERQHCTTRQLAFDARLGLATTDRAANALEVATELEDVTRLDQTLEATLVDAGEQREPAAVLLLAQHRDGTGLCERLDDQHAGHHRAPREVPAQVPLVLAHRLPGDGALARAKLEHLVDQEKGLAMRQDL